jgi:hypothetical protein
MVAPRIVSGFTSLETHPLRWPFLSYSWLALSYYICVCPNPLPWGLSEDHRLLTILSRALDWSYTFVKDIGRQTTEILIKLSQPFALMNRTQQQPPNLHWYDLRAELSTCKCVAIRLKKGERWPRHDGELRASSISCTKEAKTQDDIFVYALRLSHIFKLIKRGWTNLVQLGLDSESLQRDLAQLGLAPAASGF